MRYKLFGSTLLMRAVLCLTGFTNKNPLQNDSGNSKPTELHSRTKLTNHTWQRL